MISIAGKSEDLWIALLFAKRGDGSARSDSGASGSHLCHSLLQVSNQWPLWTGVGGLWVSMSLSPWSEPGLQTEKTVFLVPEGSKWGSRD